MSLLSFARLRHVRRISGALVLAAGLIVSGTAVSAAQSSASSAAPRPAAPSVVGLRKGAYGEAVKVLQQALIRVGVGVKYGVDSYFGSATEASVKAFQRYKGLPVTGVVDASTAGALGLAQGPAPAAAPAASGTLRRGSRGPSVKQIQQRLIASGINVFGGADGIFGSGTEAAVKAFQKARGIAASGVVDAATLSALNGGGGNAASGAAGALARGARGNAVKQLQQALTNAGITVPGGVDGIFGRGTESAVKSFQQSKGLAATGKIDAATAAALRLSGNAAPTTAPATSIGLRLGSRGPAVVELQQALIRMGWTLRGGADGIFGAATRSVVMLAQRANGIAASGTVNEATARLLKLKGTPAATPPAARPAAPAPTAAGFPAYDERGARVVALQKALIKAGIAVYGGPDGVFGAATASAVMAFQRAKGLKVTGKVDAVTAARLGLAAAAAPAPTPAVTIRLEAKPVQGPCYYGDTWAAARGNGRVHLGTDILAAEGRQLYAVVTGRVTQIYTDQPGSLSGNGLKIARADGTYFFYAHLSAFAPGIAVGTRVTAGQVVGYVGSTGNAATPHLHLEVHPLGGSAINPYPIIKAFGAC